MIMKQKWSVSHYAAVMAILTAAFCDKRYNGHFAFDEAYKTRAALSKYAYIDRYRCADLTDICEDTIVRITLTDEEMRVVDTLIAFSQAGSIEVIWPDDAVDNKYVRELVGKAVMYERKQRIKRRKCLEMIEDYVKECEAEGKKIVKKSLACDEFKPDYIYETWRMFDEQRQKDVPDKRNLDNGQQKADSDERRPDERSDDIFELMGEVGKEN